MRGAETSPRNREIFLTVVLEENFAQIEGRYTWKKSSYHDVNHLISPTKAFFFFKSHQKVQTFQFKIWFPVVQLPPALPSYDHMGAWIE